MLLAEGTLSIHVKDWSASSRSKKLCTKIKRDLEGLAPLDHSTSASLVINEPNASPPAQSWTVSDEPVPLQKLQPE